ncbi:MAG: hypothetical protein U0270_38395 [Labilithrix sp.]
MKRTILFLVPTLITVVACSSSDDATSASSSGTAASGCNPEGSWEFTAPAYTADGACTDTAASVSAGAAKSVHVFTKNSDGTYTESEPADTDDKPTKLTFDAANCTLTGEETPLSVTKLTGTDGKTSPGTLKGTDKYVINGNSMTVTLKATITATDATVKGFPCEVDGTATGTKK